MLNDVSRDKLMLSGRMILTDEQTRMLGLALAKASRIFMEILLTATRCFVRLAVWSWNHDSGSCLGPERC